MSLKNIVALLPFALLASAGCSGSSDESSELDGGVGDSAVSGDASETGTSPTDTGSDDSGSDDSSAADTNVADTNVADTNLADSKSSETGDASPGDTKVTDIGSSDSSADVAVGDTALADTAVRRGPAPVLLGSAGNYVILAQSAISTVPASAITGNLGISPAAASFVTGFSMTRVGTYWTSIQVTGQIFAADNDAPTPSLLTTAITNMTTAYTDAAGRPTPDALNLSGGALGGLTLTPGLYKWTSSVGIASDVTLSGAADDTWILQVTGDLTIASAKQVKLLGGAKAKNIVWQVAGAVDLGTTSHFEGVILGKTAITMRTGASINGRLLAQTAVAIDTSTVKTPSP